MMFIMMIFIIYSDEGSRPEVLARIAQTTAALSKLKPIWKDEPECVPRQMYSPTAYMRNGAVYVLRRENILKGIFYGAPIIPYIMPDERSICIDSVLDWYAAEAIIIAQSKREQ